MGTLFAVYDWLESQLKARWLWPGESGTVVPSTKDVFAGATGERRTDPQLIHSRLRLNTWAGGMGPEQRRRYIEENNVWLRRQRFVRGVDMDYGHAYTKYWDRFGSTHPEYFALRPDGVRAPFDAKRPNLVQMCVSSPALHQQVVADWLKQRQQTPNRPWINGIENDKTAADPACTCPNCLAWDTKGSPSYSDRYAKYWLALQTEGRKTDPNATVIGYAYADYSEPPLETKLNSHIIVGIVPRYSFPMSEADHQAFHTTWEGWRKTGAQLYLRPNYTLAGYDMPYVYAHQLGEELRFTAANGMVAMDFDSLTGMWGVQGINTYVLARLHIDPNRGVDEILDEYYSGFGPAAVQVKNYFTYWENVTRLCDKNFREHTQGGWGFVSKGGDEIYTADSFREGAALLDTAKIAAQGDAAASQRIQFLEVWLEHARLSAQALSTFHAQQKQPAAGPLKTAFVQAKTAVDDFRKQHQDIIGNTGLLRQLEVWSGWRKATELSE